MTLPGEPTTAIGARIEALAEGRADVARTLVVGYAQDHYGYLMEQEDFLRGGYEPTVSPWGYRFDAFLEGEVKALLEGLSSFAEQPLTPRPALEAPSPVEAGLSTSVAVREAPGSTSRLGIVRWRFAGPQPGLGTPQIALQRREGDGFVPVKASAARFVINGPEIILRHRPEPTWREAPEPSTPREHLWTAEWETLPDTALGEHRFVATGPGGLALESEVFEVAPSEACGTVAAMRFEGDLLALELRLPPNPTAYAQGGDPLGNLRLRDAHSRPDEGAPCLGGSVQGSVVGPDGVSTTATFTWNASLRAFTSAVAGGPGTWTVNVAPGQVQDGSGNTNAVALSLEAIR